MDVFSVTFQNPPPSKGSLSLGAMEESIQAELCLVWTGFHTGGIHAPEIPSWDPDPHTLAALARRGPSFVVQDP